MMSNVRPSTIWVSGFVHKHFIWFLSGAYLAGALFPALGLKIRDVSFGGVALLHVMLALLLFNAGLGVKVAHLRTLLAAPRVLMIGLLANVAIPIAFIVALSRVMHFWPDGDHVQNMLVGLALVASMPTAGSSAAWSQNANGNLALSLGLLVVSTLLSPLTTPLALYSVGTLATGEYANILYRLASEATALFLILCVILPACVGIVSHWRLGEERITAWKPYLTLFNSANLLLLNYTNASFSLPQAIHHPEFGFLALTLIVVVGLCLSAFGSGWLISWFCKTDGAQRTSLMFGLGMHNNGAGLVLGSLLLSEHPLVIFPIIFYNLVQHLVAGLVDFTLVRAGQED